MFLEGIKTTWSFVLDCVFPQSCLGCQEPDVFLCTRCRTQLCVGIQSKTIVFETSTPPIFEVCALSYYQSDSVVGQLIETLKYHYSKQAISEIDQWVKQNQNLPQELVDIDIIIPIPLHVRRQAERGFNQAEQIARVLGKIINKPVSTRTLIRTKATKQQARLGRAERIKNTQGAFECVKPEVLANKTILLVDDVYTTGSTMQAAAQALLLSKIKKVRGLVLARGLSKD